MNALLGNAVTFVVFCKWIRALYAKFQGLTALPSCHSEENTIVNGLAVRIYQFYRYKVAFARLENTLLFYLSDDARKMEGKAIAVGAETAHLVVIAQTIHSPSPYI